MRAALGVVIGVLLSAWITKRASWPDFFSSLMVVVPTVSVSPTLISTVNLVIPKNLLRDVVRLLVLCVLGLNLDADQSNQ